MTIYIANVNGDWWTYDNRDPLYVFDTDTLPVSDLKAILEDYEHEGDSWADVIQEFGQPISIKELI